MSRSNTGRSRSSRIETARSRASCLGTVAWLGPSFTVEDATTFDTDIIDVAIDDDGGTVVSTGSYLENEYDNAAVIGFGPDHAQAWRRDLGEVFTASLAASPAIIALTTNAANVGDTPTLGPPGTTTLVGLHASDGSVAWQKPIYAFTTFAADGTLLVSGGFTGTLDLGGTSTPLQAGTGHSGYVAALDPATGDGLWAVRVAGLGAGDGDVGPIAAGPSGEVAFVLNLETTSGEHSSVVGLLDANGLRWAQAGGAASIATDGTHVVTAVAQYSATGIDWQRPITGTGTHVANVLGLADDHWLASIHSEPLTIGGPEASTTIGDVTYAGDGLALVDLVR